MNLSTVKWAQWDKTQSRELLGLFICVCIALCTIVAHNIAQNRPDSFPPYPPDDHHISDDVYLRVGGHQWHDPLLFFEQEQVRHHALWVSGPDVWPNYHWRSLILKLRALNKYFSKNLIWFSCLLTDTPQCIARRLVTLSTYRRYSNNCIYLSVCLSVCLSVYLSIYLSISIYSWSDSLNISPK